MVWPSLLSLFQCRNQADLRSDDTSQSSQTLQWQAAKSHEEAGTSQHPILQACHGTAEADV